MSTSSSTPSHGRSRSPTDFAEALDAEPETKRFFEGLSYSRQRWHVLSIDGAKSAETRQRRKDKSMGMLREGRSR